MEADLNLVLLENSLIRSRLCQVLYELNLTPLVLKEELTVQELKDGILSQLVGSVKPKEESVEKIPYQQLFDLAPTKI